MNNQVIKTISFICGVGSIIFSTICCVYAYNHSMWYEFIITICSGCLMLYLSTMAYNMKNEDDEENDFFD